MVIAGEISGDMHAAKLVRELKAKQPDLKIWGIGGDELEAEGVEILHHVRDMAVLGLAEVIVKYFYFLKVFKQMQREVEERNPDAIILVDYPGFNLRFAKKVKPLGIKLIYYICPQVWAWKKGRKYSMAEILDRLLVIFPFEKEVFSDTKLPTHYVGHPLLEETQKVLDAAPIDLPWKEDKRVAILPGSRKQEIQRIFPVLIETVQALIKERDDVCFIVAAASKEIEQLIAEHLKPFPELSEKLQVVTGETRQVLKQARAAIVASGTATFETALMGCPLVIVYKTSWLTYEVGRRVVKLPHIGMANVVAKKEICPEFIQHEARTQNIVGGLLPLLEDSDVYLTMKQDLINLKAQLSDSENAEDASDLILRDI